MPNQHLRIKQYIKTYKNWPQAGINFIDLSELYNDNIALHQCAHRLIERYINQDITHVAVLEARAFILGSILAFALNVPIIMIRKPGKLAGKVYSSHADKNIRSLEMQTSACGENDQVLIFDDLIAQGTSSLGAVDLIKQANANIVEVSCIVSLVDLPGVQKLGGLGISVFNLCAFEGT